MGARGVSTEIVRVYVANGDCNRSAMVRDESNAHFELAAQKLGLAPGECYFCGKGELLREFHFQGCLSHEHLLPEPRRLANEHVNLKALGERDDWVCGICGYRIDPRLTRRHPLMPSVDHITPRARGGKTIPENLQIAHLRCNLQKGTDLWPHLTMPIRYPQSPSECRFRVGDVVEHAGLGVARIQDVRAMFGDFELTAVFDDGRQRKLSLQFAQSVMVLLRR